MIPAMPALSLVAIALALFASASHAAERPLLFAAEGVSPEALESGAARRGLEVARPERESDVAAESALAEV